MRDYFKHFGSEDFKKSCVLLRNQISGASFFKKISSHRVCEARSLLSLLNAILNKVKCLCNRAKLTDFKSDWEVHG